MAPAPFWLDHLLFAVLAVLFPLRAQTFGYRRLREALPEFVPIVRHSLYVQAMAIQWSLALFTIAIWAGFDRPWIRLGLAPSSTLRLVLGLAAVAILGFLLAAQRRRALHDPESLATVRRRLGNLERMLPHTAEELRLFGFLSVTAGVCEEFLYRGYLFWYLGHYIGLFPGAALAALIFGVGHAYQGWRGVLTTTIVGLVFGGVYLACGSLLPAMLAHALADHHSGILAQAAFTAVPAASSESASPADDSAPDGSSEMQAPALEASRSGTPESSV